MFGNLVSDWITGNLVKNRMKNELRLPKMVGTNVYSCYGSEKFESGIMKGITLLDSMASSKKT